jgi:kynurenine 3-monooxygenase
MLIALPNIDASFTCTLFFPFEGDPSFTSINTKDKLRIFFENSFADVVPMMPTLEQDFFSNPCSKLVTIKCYPWIRREQFALIGDAAHAVVPFFGQGMNCGFEDCWVLNQLIQKHDGDWAVILPAYQKLRKPDADAIADLSLNHYVELRDRVADPKFLLQKKIEAHLHEKYQDLWIPAYSQVTFNPDIRYSEAFQNIRLQEHIMREVMQIKGIENKWDSCEVEELILSRLREIRQDHFQYTNEVV